MVSGHMKSTKLQELRYSTKTIDKWKNNNKTAKQINWRIYMLQ